MNQLFYTSQENVWDNWMGNFSTGNPRQIYFKFLMRDRILQSDQTNWYFLLLQYRFLKFL